MPLQFEWDDGKDEVNRTKHGIGFEEAKVIFIHPVVTAQDDRRDYGRNDSSAMGGSEGRSSSWWFTRFGVRESG